MLKNAKKFLAFPPLYIVKMNKRQLKRTKDRTNKRQKEQKIEKTKGRKNKRQLEQKIEQKIE